MADKPAAAAGMYSSALPDKPLRRNTIDPEALSASEGSGQGVPACSHAWPEAQPLIGVVRNDSRLPPQLLSSESASPRNSASRRASPPACASTPNEPPTSRWFPAVLLSTWSHCGWSLLLQRSLQGSSKRRRVDARPIHLRCDPSPPSRQNPPTQRR